MKIVHLQYGIKQHGNSVIRLHNEMIRYGLDSYIFCVTSSVKSDRIKSFGFFRLKKLAIQNKITRYIFRRSIISNFSVSFLGNNIERESSIMNADIIYLHWAQGGFLNLNNIERIIKLGKPVILSLRDFWYMTGGCHHPILCQNYMENCGNCPYLADGSPKDISYKQLKRKKRIYDKYENIFAFVSSNWMVEKVKRSSLLSVKKIYCIPNTLDETIFKPIPAKLAQNELGLKETSKKRILFGSVNPTSNKNKGWEVLIESISILHKIFVYDFEILIFGSNGTEEMKELFPVDITFLGRITDERRMANVYSVCDTYVTPSLSEPFGNTVLESLACGTPVVSFSIGGAKDMIVHKRNGYLAEYNDSNDFAMGIQYCLSNIENCFLKEANKAKNIIEDHLTMISEVSNFKVNFEK